MLDTLCEGLGVARRSLRCGGWWLCAEGGGVTVRWDGLFVYGRCSLTRLLSLMCTAVPSLELLSPIPRLPYSTHARGWLVWRWSTGTSDFNAVKYAKRSCGFASPSIHLVGRHVTSDSQ